MRNLKKYSNHSGPGGYMLYDAEVEYLESDKNQYIDVGIKPDANTGVMITVTYKSGNNYNYIFGCKTGSSAYGTALGGNRIHYFTNNTSTGGPLCPSSVDTTLYYNYLGDGLFRTSINTTTYELGTFDTMQDNLRCLGCNGSSSNYIGKLKAFKVTQNQNIVRDMIPVRVGQVGYLYDKVSGELFGNSGSGSFVLGEDVGDGKPADVNLALNKVSICKSEGHTHYDKKVYSSEIEYLESDGNQWVNTEIVPTTNTVAEGNFMYTKFVAYGAILSNYISENHNVYRIILTNSSGNVYFCCNTKAGGGSVSTTCSLGVKHSFTLDSTGLTIDGVKRIGSTANGTANDTELVLFTNKSTEPTIRDIGCTIYDLKIYESGVLVRDMYPVRVGQVGYMYDKISKRLFGNSGTGTFTLGPDI